RPSRSGVCPRPSPVWVKPRARLLSHSPYTTLFRSAGPTISSISPQSVPASTFDLTINGSNFDSGAVDQVYNPSGAFIGQGTILSPADHPTELQPPMNLICPRNHAKKNKNSHDQLSN